MTAREKIKTLERKCGYRTRIVIRDGILYHVFESFIKGVPSRMDPVGDPSFTLDMWAQIYRTALTEMWG